MTLYANIYVVNSFLFLFFVCLPSCGGKHNVSHVPRTERGVTIKELDVAKTGKADTWQWIKRDQENREILWKEELDLNHDGKVDVTRIFDGGRLSQVNLDLDFDGISDVKESYENDVLQKMELSHSFSGKPDTWRYYDHGTLSRVERDTNQDGKPDEWMFYQEGKLARVARDYNADGIVDTWDE